MIGGKGRKLRTRKTGEQEKKGRSGRELLKERDRKSRGQEVRCKFQATEK